MTKVLPFTILKNYSREITFQVDTHQNLYEKLHYHNEIQLSYIEKGFGSIFINNMFYPFEKGNIILIGSDAPHVFLNNKARRPPLKINTILFDPIIINDILSFANATEYLRLKLLHLKYGLMFTSNLTKALNVVQKIGKSNGLNRLKYFVKLLSLISESDYIELSQSFESLKNLPKNQSLILKVINYTLENFNLEINLKDISSLTYMTPNAFCKFFKSHTRKSYFEFLKMVRIENAKNIITNDPYISLKEVTHQVGFKNPSQFRRAFTFQCGMKPQEFKQKLLNEFDENLF